MIEYNFGPKCYGEWEWRHALLPSFSRPYATGPDLRSHHPVAHAANNAID
jgi:hypothetical protein